VRASGNDEKVIVKESRASCTRNADFLGVNVDTLGGGENEFKLNSLDHSEISSAEEDSGSRSTYRILFKAVGNRSKKLLIRKLSRHQSPSRCQAPIHMGIRSHQNNFTVTRLPSLPEESMSGADPRIGTAENNNLLHRSRVKTWTGCLLKIVCIEEAEDGTDDLSKEMEHFFNWDRD